MSKRKSIFIVTTLAYCLLGRPIVLYGQQAKPETSIENIFQIGLMAQDTNGDQIADAICGHVIVPKSPSAAENTAAANLAARLGYETSALTLPIVVAATGQMAKSCPAEKANLWVGREAFSAGAAPVVDHEIAQDRESAGTPRFEIQLLAVAKMAESELADRRLPYRAVRDAVDHESA